MNNHNQETEKTDIKIKVKQKPIGIEDFELERHIRKGKFNPSLRSFKSLKSAES